MKEKLVSKKELLSLERQYAKTFDNWNPGDTIYSFFKRIGMESMAEAFKKDYERHDLSLTK